MTGKRRILVTTPHPLSSPHPSDAPRDFSFFFLCLEVGEDIDRGCGFVIQTIKETRRRKKRKTASTTHGLNLLENEGSSNFS